MKNLLTDKLVHTASDIIIGIDLSGTIVYANLAARRFYGYDENELIGEQFTHLLPKVLSAEFEQVKEEILLHDYTEPFDSQRVTKKRKKVKVSVAYSVIKDISGKIIGISSVERKIMERRRVESKAQALLETAPDAVVIVNTTGQIVLVNAKTEELFGYQRGELLGQEVERLLPAHFRRDHVKHRKKFYKKPKARHMGTGMELLGQRKNGSWFPVEISLSPFSSEEGTLISAVIRDITDRKQAEKKLAESERKYRLLADNMLDMVALHAPDGTYQYISPSVKKLLGYKPKELIGQNPYELFHPDDIQRIRADSHTPAGTGEEIPNMEYRIRKKDGAYIWFSTNTKPIKNENGEVVMLQTVSRDVTERVGVMQRLEEINAQKNKLFSVIGHDLRSPLSSCIGLLDLIDMEMEGLQHKALDMYLILLRQSVVNLLDLLDDLLMWVSTQSDGIALKPHMLDLSFEVAKVVQHLAEAAKVKNIDIRVSVDKSLRVFADGHMLDTIIRNLLSNSIKFTHEEGVITINAKLAGNMTVISITDNGIGMKEETVSALFTSERNHTIQGTKGEKGTGLGLQLCKDFVERLGGNIWAESEYGKGSTFSFSVPNYP